MAATETAKSAQVKSVAPSRIVEARQIVSAPGRTIQVERLQVSSTQVSSISAAIRAGKAAAEK